MSLEKFIKKLKKFLENRAAKLDMVEVKMYDLNEYKSVLVYYEYNKIDLISTRYSVITSNSLKNFSKDIFEDIEKNISNVQNLHKGEIK